MSAQQNVHIRFRSFDNKLLDKILQKIMLLLNRSGATMKGPILLPRRIKRFVVNRSPHIDKKSRDQMEMRIYNRLIVLEAASPSTMQALTNLQVPSGVDIEVTVIEDKK